MKNTGRNRNAMAYKGDRFFPNKFDDYTIETAADLIENNKPKESSTLKQLLPQKWQSFRDINRANTTKDRDYTVYTGSAGIAMVKLLKSPHDPETLEEVKQLLKSVKLKNRDYTFLCGDAGPLAIGSVVAYRQGDVASCQDLIKDLATLINEVLDIRSRLPNEYLYGRAGYLYALLYVNKHINPPPIPDELIRQVIEAILNSGKSLARSCQSPCPLMYEWHLKYYLGAAHGIAGILYLLLQVPEYLTDEELNTLIRPTIVHLESQRFPSGNFPSSINNDSDKYVQWCHGAPGFVYLFLQAAKVFNHPPYRDIALKCGDVIWERGLLSKGYSLCHGVAGNAYCFLELYQQTQDPKHLYRAIKFAEWCDASDEHEKHLPDRPMSLYEGIAGPMYLLLDIQNPMEAKFPGFSL